MVEIVVDNRVRLPLEQLDSSVASRIRSAFDHRNPKYFRMRKMGFYPKGEPRVVSTWQEDNGSLTVPRGGFKRVRETLEEHGLRWTWRDERTLGDRTIGIPPRHTLTLYDYQVRAMLAALARENCIVRAPTGSGKTTVLLALAARVQVPTLVVVHTTGLLAQWAERAGKEMGLFGEELGLIQGKTRRIRPLTLAMQQTLNRADAATWAAINRTFGAVVADEVHLFAAGTFLSTVDRCRARYRIGVSADHTRADRKEFLIEDVFGDVAAEVSREELIAREFVHDVEVVLEPTAFEAPWYELQRRVARMRDEGMDFDDVYAALLAETPGLSPDDVPSGPADYTRLIEEMCADDARNEQILELAGDLARRGHKLLVYSHRVEHCRMLASRLVGAGVRCGLLLGGEYQDEFERTIARLKSGDAVAGVGTWQAMGTGIDVPVVDRGIVTTPIQTKQLWGQIRGRLCRTAEGKRGARAHVMWDRRVFGDQTVRNMAAWNSLARVRGADGSLVPAREHLGGRK